MMRYGQPTMEEKNVLWVKFGNWLKVERRSRGLTQEKVADDAGLNRTHLSDIENGNTGVKRDTVIRLAHAVGVKPEMALNQAGFAVVEAFRFDEKTGEETATYTTPDEERIARLFEKHLRAFYLDIQAMMGDDKT